MKENFIKSTLILIIGGFFTKILAMTIKIGMARVIGTQGLGLYMMLLPTFNLCITISQFGIPLALSKLISEDTRNNKKLFLSILPISIIINIFMMIFIILLAPAIANTFLKNKDLTISIYAISLVIPFTTTSSICRSYFFGKNQMLPHVISNLIEEILRLLIIIWFIPIIIPYGINITVCFLILSNIVSESISTIILLLYLPKNVTFHKNDFILNKTYVKESLQICIPNTTSRLIGSIGLFLEPIILTNVLLKVGYPSWYVTKEYGILSGYIIPLLLIPSFFTLAISQALLPTISKAYAKKDKALIKKKLKQSITLSLMIGVPTTIIMMTKPSLILKTIYHTTAGIKYLKVLVPICLFQYFQSPLGSTLEAIGKSKELMKITLLSTIIRTLLTFLLSYLKIGLWGLIIAISINILITTILEYYQIKKYL